ncbi:hypothetical protein HID58_070409 [Brassica napus]|uniref:DUF3444 domain-containing protein n=1 Tax=Brassica napus TaxID=3708 RepID=A0ABQ7YYN0_BRANA|nr:hypothetical protein HID58_070409 [Brassica napus]
MDEKRGTTQEKLRRCWRVIKMEDKRAKSRKRSRHEMAEKDIDENCLIRKHKHDAKEKETTSGCGLHEDDGTDEDPEPYCYEMPRYYARIRKILDTQLSLGVRWLESKANKKSVPIACGEFKTGKKTITINPRKGETWALFRDWKPQYERPYRYDFVKIESELDSDHGIGVAYLGRVEGFTSVYEHAVQHDYFKMMIPSDEMLRFSHRFHLSN